MVEFILKLLVIQLVKKCPGYVINEDSFCLQNSALWSNSELSVSKFHFYINSLLSLLLQFSQAVYLAVC